MPEPKPGDYVKIMLADEELQGLLIPRPDLLDPSFIVLKLDTGYNIGIDKKKIKKIGILKPYKEAPKKKTLLAQNPKLPNISILSTGGTISSRVDYKTGGVYADYTAEDFVEMCPELKKIANLKTVQISNMMSEDMDYKDWQNIANLAAKELEDNDIEGVIITQGTDTLHYTAAALSFMLKDLKKPVILTAAQRSIDRGSSDAFMNLICSAHAAASSDIPAVMTCMHATSSDDYCFLIKGTKVRKMHTSKRDAFRPVNDLPLAKVSPDGKIEKIISYPKKDDKRFSVDTAFEDKIALIHVHPGMDPGIIDYYLDKGIRGIVLAATALGHVPTNSDLNILDQLEKAQKKGVPVIIASQTLYGRVHPYVYTNLRKLSVEKGCIFVEDMLPETAYIKLGWVLAHAKDNDEVRNMMTSSLVGEIRERISPKSYLY